MKKVLSLRQAIIAEPDNPDNHCDLGVALIQMGNYKTALESFKRVIQLDSAYSRAMYNQALCYYHLGFIDSAIIAYEETLSLNPNDDQALVNLATIFFERQNLSDALDCLEKAVGVNPANGQAWKHLGILRYHKHQYRESTTSIKKALEIDSSDDVSWEQLGLSHYAINQMEEAVHAYKKALEQNGHRGEIWNNLGNAYLKQNKIAEAENAYQHAIELDSTNTDVWFNLGELAFLHKNRKEAIPFFKKVLKKNKNDLEAWEYLAKCQYEDNPREARKSLETIIELGGESEENLGLLAELYDKTNSSELVLKTRLKLAKINPFDQDNNFKIATIKLNLGKGDSAYSYFKESLILSKEKGDIWFKLSQYFHFSEEIEKELDCLSRTIKANSTHYPAWHRLGTIASEKGLINNAFEYYIKSAPSQKNNYTFWIALMETLCDEEGFEPALQCCNHFLELAVFLPETLKSVYNLFKKYGQKSRFVEWLVEKGHGDDISMEIKLAISKVFRSIGETEREEALLKRLQSEKRYQPDGSLALVVFYLDHQYPARAIDILNSLDETYLNDYQPLNLKGETHLRLGHLDQAESYLRKALDTRQDDFKVWENYGQLKSERNQHEDALEFFQSSLEIASDNANSWYHKGMSETALGRLKDANDSFLKAIKIERRHYQAWNALGRVFLLQNNYQYAKYCLLRSLASNREYTTAWENLADVFEQLNFPQKAESCRQRVAGLQEKIEEESRDG